MSGKSKNIMAFKHLYNSGAFLVRAGKHKGPISKMLKVVGQDAEGKDIIKPVKDEWNNIEKHLRAGGDVLYYNPGAQGLLVLDFDPMVEEWLDAVSDRLGAPPMSQWESSGNLKDALGDKPSGYGGHAAWKCKPEDATMLRHFAYMEGGFVVGQVFSGHPGFGFIVYAPTPLMNIIDADPIECVDPSLLYKGMNYNNLKDGQGWSTSWKPNPNSRHDSTMSVIAESAWSCVEREDFELRLEAIRDQFLSSLSGEQGRDVEGEFERMESRGWELWDRDRRKEQSNSQMDLTSLLNPKQSSDGDDTTDEESDDLLIRLQQIEPIHIPTKEELDAPRKEDNSDTSKQAMTPEEKRERISTIEAEYTVKQDALTTATRECETARKELDDMNSKRATFSNKENAIKIAIADTSDEGAKKSGRKELKEISDARRAADGMVKILNTKVDEHHTSIQHLQVAVHDMSAELQSLGCNPYNDKSRAPVAVSKALLMRPHRASMMAHFDTPYNMAKWEVSKSAINDIRNAWWEAATSDQDADAADPVAQVLSARCGKIACVFDMPDTTNLRERLMLLWAGRLAGVNPFMACEIMSNASKQRKHAKMKPHGGKPPNARQRIRGGHIHSTLGDAIDAIRRHGGVLCPHRVENDPQDIAMLLRACGMDAQFSYIDAGFVVTHAGLRGWSKPSEHTTLIAPDYDHIQRIRDAMRQACFTIEEDDETGVLYIKPAIQEGWCTGKTMLNHFNALKGNTIPIVDLLEKWTRGIMDMHADASPEYIGECVDMVENLFLRIPGVKPAHGHEGIAKAASRIVHPTFMLRRIQSMPGEGKGIKSQRYVPVIGGDKGVGKTTIAVSLIPHEGGVEGEQGQRAIEQHGAFEGRVNAAFSFNSDVNECLRQMRGNVYVVNDELAGLAESNVNSVKSVITFRTGKSHAKYENYKEMKRTDVLVGTTNESDNIPKNAPMRDRLLAFRLERSDPTMSDEAVYNGINHWLASHYTQLFIGGLELAKRVNSGTYSINPPSDITIDRGRALENLSLDGQHIADTIESMIESGIAVSWEDVSGNQYMSVERVLLYMNKLRYRNDVKKTRTVTGPYEEMDRVNVLWRAGETISPSHRSSIDKYGNILHYGNEFSPWVEMAIRASGSEPAIKSFKTQVKNVAEGLIGSAPKRIRVPRKSLSDWISNDQKTLDFDHGFQVEFHGDEVQDSLDKHQNSFRYCFLITDYNKKS